MVVNIMMTMTRGGEKGEVANGDRSGLEGDAMRWIVEIRRWCFEDDKSVLCRQIPKKQRPSITWRPNE
jgi:hypothetical protein